MLSRLKNRLASIKKATTNTIPNLPFDKFDDLLTEGFKEGHSDFEKKLENISFEINAYTYLQGQDLEFIVELDIKNLLTNKKANTYAQGLSDYVVEEDVYDGELSYNRVPNYDVSDMDWNEATYALEWKKKGTYRSLSLKELYEALAKDIAYHNENPHEDFLKHFSKR